MAKKIKIVESRLNRREKTYTYSNVYKHHIHAVMSLLDILEIGKKERPLAMDTCIKWAELTVKYFFWSLIETGKCSTQSIKRFRVANVTACRPTDMNLRKIAIDRAYSLLARQCSERKYSRAAALRELLEGALYSYGNLFGIHLDIDSEKSVQPKHREERLLIKLNQIQNNTPNNIRSFLHAGVIGKGLKLPSKEASSPDSDIRNMLLKAISVCCKNEVIRMRNRSKKKPANCIFRNRTIKKPWMVLRQYHCYWLS